MDVGKVRKREKGERSKKGDGEVRERKGEGR